MNIGPIAFSLFGFEFRWYALLVTAGIVAGVLTAYYSAPKYGWKSDDIIDVALIAVPLAILGARIYYVVFYWDYYGSHPEDILKIWNGGLAIWGGIIGGILGGALYCKWKKKDLITLLDIGLPGIAIGQAIGRWGNFFNQEAYGAAITSPGMQWFPFAVHINATGQYHYATFFYESLWCFLLFLFLLTQRKRFRHKGDVALSYLMLYSFERMFVEGLRTDSLWLGPFRVSQVLSGIIFVVIALFFLLRHFRENKTGIAITNPLHAGYVAPAAPQDTHKDENQPIDNVTGDPLQGNSADLEEESQDREE